MRTTLLSTLLAAASMTAAVVAQDGSSAAAGLRPEHFHTPIVAIDGTEWGSGYDFKASFHDGFRFFARGRAEPASLRWRTTGIGLEGQVSEVSAAVRERTIAGYRAEYHFPGFDEVYEVRPEGVAQGFLIRDRPTGNGDLILRGHVDTELRVRDRVAAHAPISFLDADGRPVIEYGEAFVVDPDGVKTAIPTRVVRGQVEIVVPSAIWRHASFPLCVDPLIRTGNRIANPVAGELFGRVRVVQTEVGTRSDLYVGVTMVGADRDAYVFRCEAGMRNPRVIWSDVRWNVSTDCLEGCYVGGAQTALFRIAGRGRITWNWERQWILRVAGTTPTVQLRSVSVLNPTRMGGTRPGASGSKAVLIGWQRRTLSSGRTEFDVLAWLIDANTGLAGAPIVVDQLTSSTFYAGLRDPLVSTAKDGRTDPWLVVWHDASRDVSQVRQIWDDGRLGARSYDIGAPYVRQITGGSGRHLAVRVVNTGSAYIDAVRIDWTGSAGPRLSEPQVVQRASSEFIAGLPLSLAFDTNTRSHWALLNERPGFFGQDLDEIRVMRLGWDGSVVESQAYLERDVVATRLLRDRFSNLTFDRRRDRFLSLQARTGAAIEAYELTHAGWVLPGVYGTGCSGATISTVGRPYAGTRSYPIVLRGAPGRRPALLHVSPRAASFPGTGPGCTVLVDGAAAGATTIPVMTNVFGTASHGLELPANVAFYGMFLFGQWSYLDSYPLTFGGRTFYYDVERRTAGLRLRIGP